MITYFNEFVKLNLKKLENLHDFSSQQEYIQSCMPTLKHLHYCKCPKCGCIDNFSFHCKYNRNITFVLNGQIVNFIIIVTRVICNSCKSTHALLPDFIVPYKIMSSFSIVKIVKDAFYSSVAKTADKLSVSYQQIYYYISLFLSFFANVSILNNTNKYFDAFDKTIYLEQFSSLCCDHNFSFKFHYEYFSFFKWIFLMSKFRNTNYNAIYIGMAESRST